MKLIYLNFFFLALIIYQIFFRKIIENYQCDINNPTNSDCQNLTMEKNETKIPDLQQKINKLEQRKHYITKLNDRNNYLIKKNIKSIQNLKNTL